MKTKLSSADGRREPLEAEEKVTSRVETPAALPAVRKNKGGRPKGSGVKLTPKLQELFCAAVAGAMPLTRAAKLCGISLDTFERWCAKGRESIEPYKSFVAAYENAELSLEQFLLKTIKDAAPEDYRAALAMLKMRFPKSYSDHAARLEVFGPGGDGPAGSGLNIILHLGLEDLPQPGRRPDPRLVEIEDHRRRERDIENAALLAAAPIKDEL